MGDTIRWTWMDGTHTTTSTSIPTGATTWNAPLDVDYPEYKYVVTVAGQYQYDCIYHAAMGMTGSITANPTGITPISGNVPIQYKLYQNYPNPFNPTTIIKFDLPANSNVKLTVYDIAGNEVARLVNQQLQAGSYSFNWNASAISSGVYLYKLQTERYSETHKMILVK